MRGMRECGIRWVGKIPYSWKVDKNKHYFNLEKNIVGDKMNDYELLSLTKKGVIKKDENSIGGKVPESFETYQSVKQGQIVMCLFDLDVSAVFSGLSPYNGMISPAYKIYNCNKDMYNKYAKYWFECCFDGRKYKAYSKSLRYVVNTEDFGPIEIVVPPIEEQHKIADFLDKKVLEIDSIIEKTKETIEDYKKYKQSIITEVVTKGLDKNAEMKDSKIKWIGFIPKDWKVLKIKNILEWKSEKNHENEQVLSLYRDYGVIPKDSRDDNHNVTSEDTRSYKFVEVGDFVINKMKAWQGSMAVSEYTGIISPAYHVCRFTNKNINKKYFHYLLRNQLYLPEFRRLSTGLRIGQWDLGFEDFKNLMYILPSIKEQEEIVKFLEKKCTDIDKLIFSKEKIIEELEKYKKSLIYEYVTGKKEVI